MICDSGKPVAIAGVMGGENSEINRSTKNILIESAYFKPACIRKTSRGLGLNTEASYRFERNTDPEGTVFAAKRAAKLIAELSGGKILKGIIDVYTNKISPGKIRLRYDRINKILGYEISQSKVINILKKLGFKVITETEKELQILTTSFRFDVEREIDLIEEIARIDGYDNIPTVSKISVTLDKKFDESEFRDNLRIVSQSLGLFEMINNPMQNEKLSHLTGKPIRILNPQNNDMAFLRTSLLPGALNIISGNINLGEKNLFLYEIGNIFNKISNDIEKFDDFIEEEKMIIAVTGLLNQKEWFSEEKHVDFYYLKGIVNSLTDKIFLDNILDDSYNQEENSYYEYYFSKSFNGNQIGYGGKVKKEFLNHFEIDQDVFCFELDIKSLKSIHQERKKYQETLRYPKIIRDFAFIFDKSLTYNEVKIFIEKESSELVKSVKLFDLFEDKSLGKDKKSMAFKLIFYSTERTLTEEEVEKEFNRLIKAVTKKFNASLRGGI
jgi:phenylalanyl-tRNA synthetase beta chain